MEDLCIKKELHENNKRDVMSMRGNEAIVGEVYELRKDPYIHLCILYMYFEYEFVFCICILYMYVCILYMYFAYQDGKPSAGHIAGQAKAGM